MCVISHTVLVHAGLFTCAKLQKSGNLTFPPVFVHYLFSKMYRPLHQAVCGECRAARRGEETCGWEAGRDSEQNVPALLGWPQVQAGHWHRSGDTQAGHLWENHPWVGMCKRQEVPVARLFQVWIQKSSARSILLWNLPCFVWTEQKIKLGVFSSACSWKAEPLRTVKYRSILPAFRKSLSYKFMRKYSQEAWLCALFLRYSLSAAGRDTILA